MPGEVVIFTTRDASLPNRSKSPGATLGTAADAFARVRVERVERFGDTPHCDLRAVLERLAVLEVNDLWVEAGPALNGALLDAGLVDELIIYIAPHLLGDGARGMFSISPPASLADRLALVIDDVRRVGADLRILARPVPVAGV